MSSHQLEVETLVTNYLIPTQRKRCQTSLSSCILNINLVEFNTIYIQFALTQEGIQAPTLSYLFSPPNPKLKIHQKNASSLAIQETK